MSGRTEEAHPAALLQSLGFNLHCQAPELGRSQEVLGIP